MSNGYPYVGIGDLKAAGEVDFEKARKVSPDAFRKQFESFDIFPGAFIFGKIGTLGQPTRIPHERFLCSFCKRRTIYSGLKRGYGFYLLGILLQGRLTRRLQMRQTLQANPH